MKFKRGKAVGFKVGVYGKVCGNTKEKPATNACVFATRKEAVDAGNELLSRWMAPEGHRPIEQTKEPPNYVFENGRPRPMTQQELEDVAFEIAKHNTKPLAWEPGKPLEAGMICTYHDPATVSK